MDDAVRAEIEDLHVFFEGWLAGRLTQDAATFERLERSLAPGFLLITPDGAALAREPLIDHLRAAHGVRGAQFKLWVREPVSRALGGGLHLALYEEWQTLETLTTARVSSALLRERSDAPHGLEWVHVHETWLPEEEA